MFADLFKTVFAYVSFQFTCFKLPILEIKLEGNLNQIKWETNKQIKDFSEKLEKFKDEVKTRQEADPKLNDIEIYEEIMKMLDEFKKELREGKEKYRQQTEELEKIMKLIKLLDKDDDITESWRKIFDKYESVIRRRQSKINDNLEILKETKNNMKNDISDIINLEKIQNRQDENNSAISIYKATSCPRAYEAKPLNLKIKKTGELFFNI